jgi:hypothetical protein
MDATSDGWQESSSKVVLMQSPCHNLYEKIIQGVSEFHQQTFRADSMIKNKHKTLNTYRVKNA